MKLLWILAVLFQSICCSYSRTFQNGVYREDCETLPVVKKVQEYIQIDTSKPENYDLVVAFWKRLAREASLPIEVHRPAGLPICVLTWTGSQPELPSIVLNTHSDVVPAYEDLWHYPPFGGVIDRDGNLYGRGAQDTKGLAIQHYEAIRELQRNNVTLKRTVHITIVPDEEMGGYLGIKEFVITEAFKKLNIGFAFDEGISAPDSTYLATYVDKRPWQVNMTFYGKGGHGSEFNNKGVIEKLSHLLNSISQFEEEQRQLMIRNNNSDLGLYTTINVNGIKTGIATNIIPSVMNVIIDIRLARDANIDDMQHVLDHWKNITGPGTNMDFIRHDLEAFATPTDNSNPYWVAMQDAAREMNITIKPLICPATSDMMVLRKLGIPALGFTPTINTASRMHTNDEFLHLDTFLHGIQVMANIVKKVGMVPA
ncbi:unnamed protein product [Leptosia nina]|uniref:N-acyl-aliphatic-L-amino acid amidohydrolase n=1 Tax=Leptosia nina TaxID=320188 RepID=A0AAV1IVH0_9NEOP